MPFSYFTKTDEETLTKKPGLYSRIYIHSKQMNCVQDRNEFAPYMHTYVARAKTYNGFL